MRVVFVGEIFHADLSVGGGPMPGGPGVMPPIYYPPSGGGSPPGIWPSPGHPAHPIAPGGQPPGIWGGAPLPWPTPPIHPGGPTPMPPIYWPPGGGGGGGSPPGIWPSPGHPAHPIAPGGRPPGIWGGGNVPMPTPPIFLPPGTIPGLKPEHPIYIPPSIWPDPGVPTHPIVLPPPGSEDKPEVLENWDAKVYWSDQTGWGVAIVPSEEHPGTPTPSRRE